MVKKKLINIIFFILIISSFSTYANPNLDQWLETEKSYKDLINEGYEVKSYSISEIQTGSGLMLILFVTVLQKDKNLLIAMRLSTGAN